MWLKTRQREAEIMDQPGLERGRHLHALRGLERINAWSGAGRIFWPDVARLGRELKRPLRILDVASGAGDVPLRLWRRAARRGLDVQIEGCDKSETAGARPRCALPQAPRRFFEFDALAQALPPADIVCSLFLHHLDERGASLLA